MKKVKQEHAIIDRKCLRPLNAMPSVKKIIPGPIVWRKKTTRVVPGLYYQRPTETGLKMAIKHNMYIQEVHVVLDAGQVDANALRSCVENPKRIDW